MDSIMSNDSFAKYGLYFSRDGWKVKYQLTEWLNKFLPLWLSKFLAFDVLVVFTELYKVAKMIMIISFMVAIFGFTIHALIAYFVWGLLFSFFYAVIR
jgi:hypothetical protein